MGKKPDYRCVTAKEGGDGKVYYHQVGAAWSNTKGGFKIVLESMPLGNEILVFPNEKDKSEDND